MLSLVLQLVSPFMFRLLGAVSLALSAGFGRNDLLFPAPPYRRLQSKNGRQPIVSETERFCALWHIGQFQVRFWSFPPLLLIGVKARADSSTTLPNLDHPSLQTENSSRRALQHRALSLRRVHHFFHSPRKRNDGSGIVPHGSYPWRDDRCYDTSSMCAAMIDPHFRPLKNDIPLTQSKDLYFNHWVIFIEAKLYCLIDAFSIWMFFEEATSSYNELRRTTQKQTVDHLFVICD